MRIARFCLFVLLGAVPVYAQSASPVATAPGQTAAVPAGSAKIWEGRNAEFEEFLRATPFTKVVDVPIGVTNPKRGYFPPGGLIESAAWKPLQPGRSSGFWESYMAEIAAYELDKLLGMGMVPPAVEKKWDGETGAAIQWVKPVRSWKEVEKLPKPDKFNRQAIRMKMFDNLIANIDRNAGNLIVDSDWNLYLIDHSRAFTMERKLPVSMSRIDQALWDKMLGLDEPTLKTALGKWIDSSMIRATLKRRDDMKGVIEDLVKRVGPAAYVK